MSNFFDGSPPLPRGSPPPRKGQEKYSPTQYSPSRATTPLSDEDSPPPPLPPLPAYAPLPPKKVLGSSEAKKRLQAFKNQKFMKTFKSKAADIFAEDEDEVPKEPKAEKKVESKKEPESAIASIMKEEMEERAEIQERTIQLAKLRIEKAMEEQQRKQEEEEAATAAAAAEAKKKRDASSKTAEKSKDKGDLREELKRKEKERLTEGSTRKDGGDRSRVKDNREKEDLRSVLERMKKGRQSPDDRGRRDRSEESKERRKHSGDRDDRDRRGRDREGSRGDAGRSNGRRSDTKTPAKDTSPDRRGRSGSKEDRRVRSRSKEQPSVKADRSLSKEGKTPRKSSKSKDPVSGGSSGGGSSEKKKTKIRETDEVKSAKKDLWPGIREDLEDDPRDTDARTEKSKKKKRPRSSAGTPMKAETSKVTPAKKKKKKDVDVAGSRVNLEETIEINTTQDDSFESQDNNFLVTLATEEDYFLVKNSERDMSLLPFKVDTKNGPVLYFPAHMVRETQACPASSIKWSYNPLLARDPEKERMLRASVDSALSELENEVLAKQSQEREPSSTKKKKKKAKKEKGKKKILKGLKGKKAEKMKKILELIEKKKKKVKKKKLEKEMKAAEEEVRTIKQVESDTGDEGSGAELAKQGETSIPTTDVAPPLSNAGMSKLFALAGYTTKEKEPKEKLVPATDAEESGAGKEILKRPAIVQSHKPTDLTPPSLSKYADLAYPEHRSPALKLQDKLSTPGSADTRGEPETTRSTPDHTHSPLHRGQDEAPTPVKDDDQYTPLLKEDDDQQHTPVKDDRQTPLMDDDRSTPLLKENVFSMVSDDRATPVKDEMTSISRMRNDRGPRTPSPRLPKMRDSRSPTKVPIMRDQRSPLHPAAAAGRSPPRRGPSPYSDHSSSRHRQQQQAGNSDGGGRYSDDRQRYESDRGEYRSADYKDHGGSRRPSSRDGLSSRDESGYSKDSLYSPTRSADDPRGLYAGLSPRRSDNLQSRSPRGYHHTSPRGHPASADVYPPRSRSPRGGHPVGAEGYPPTRGRSPLPPHYDQKREPSPFNHAAAAADKGMLLSPGRSRDGGGGERDSHRDQDGGYGQMDGGKAYSPSRSYDRGRSPRSDRDYRKRSTSYDRRRSSLERRDGRHGSPGGRRGSLERRDGRVSPSRRGSLERRDGRYSPGRRSSLDRRDGRHSPRRYSPRRHSPLRSPRRHSRSPRRHSPGRSPRGRSRYSPGRSPRRYSPRRRSRSPRRRSPGRSPRRYSPHRDRRSPYRRRYDSPKRGYEASYRGASPRRRSPGRYSPGRGTPPRHLSPGKYRRTPSPGRRLPGSPGRRGTPPPLSGHPVDNRRGPPLSPSRGGHYSPADRHRGPGGVGGRGESPRKEVRPDSTIPDGELNHDKGSVPRPAFNASVKESEFSNSPQRISLDERLEKELGLKTEAVPPPQTQQQPLGTGLPATIPTYDNTPIEPPKPKVPIEKEQAIVAAQLVTTKLMEMQAAKEAERQRKREQRMAERIAMMSSEQQKAEGGSAHEQQQMLKTTTTSVATGGRILQQVEMQEMQSEEQKFKKKKKEDNSAPTLITLKPFYRPHEKKGRRKRPETPEEDWDDYTDEPRSPVPLPDNSLCKPVLVKLGFGMSIEKRKAKNVKYKDGVVPGQGSPDHSGERSPKPSLVPAAGKKYKKVRLTIIRAKSDETDSPPPPPPPLGSPPRFPLHELIAKYGEQHLVNSTA